MNPWILVARVSLEPIGFRLNSLAFLRRASFVSFSQSSWDLALSSALNLGFICDVEAIIIGNFLRKYQQRKNYRKGGLI